jgi:hypothetical protein
MRSAFISNWTPLHLILYWLDAMATGFRLIAESSTASIKAAAVLAARLPDQGLR